MLKRILVIIAFAASIGLAACGPAATTAPTVGAPAPTDTPAPLAS